MKPIFTSNVYKIDRFNIKESSKQIFENLLNTYQVVIVIGIFIFILLLICLVIVLFSIFGKKQPKLLIENIPDQLGLLENVPKNILIEKLNSSLEDEYKNHVKKRFLKENSNCTEADFEWRLFELKRYFLLAKILKKVPMFSEEVDEVWHSMILFTKDYEQFSNRFYGNMLHHYPNTSQEPAPQDRAFFDWVFSQLFSITEFSWKSWGDFFKEPLDKKTLAEFRTMSIEDLIHKYFKNNEENAAIITYLIEQMKQQLGEAESRYQKDPKGDFSKQRKFGDMTGLSLIMVFYSTFYFDEYWEHAKEFTYATVSSNTSGCSSAVFCGVGSDDSGHHSGGGHDGGGDSGGSSCSSCGGGCSS